MRLDVEHLTVEYGQFAAVHDLSLNVGDGELVALLGPSGCGKTTTLGFITGFIRARTGRVLFDGVDVTARSPQKRGIGYVFQDYAIYPHMTVRENIRFPLDAAKAARRKANRDVEDIAALVRVEELLDRRPHQLSGGQRQRVALARALVKRPGVLLLDEPLSNLDAHQRVDVRAEIRRLQLSLGMTTILVTHDQSEAMAIADRVAVMTGGQIDATTSPAELYARPPSLFAARFIGSPQMNIWEVDGADADLARRLAPAVAARDGKSVLIGARPEHVELGAGDVAATIRLVEQLGRDSLVHLTAGPSTVRALVPAGSAAALATDQEVRIRVLPANVHLFDATSGRRIEPETAGSEQSSVTAQKEERPGLAR
ncbi:MAG TPA: ABC transporter ATP-binding protein [Candidatus Limnocylindrales bacterium]|jgi:ABC-type sugar transport system ATPase subunit